MAVRRYQLTLSSATVPVRLSDVYGAGVGIVNPATDIPYRHLGLQQEGLTERAGATMLIGTPADLTLSPGGPTYADYQALILAEGAISYWPLGDTSGTMVSDHTGARPGTITGGVTLGAPGVVPGDGSGAMAFDGTGWIATAPLPELVGGFSQEAWIWLAVPGAAVGRAFLERDRFFDLSTTFDVASDGGAYTYLRASVWSHPPVFADRGPSLSAGVWYHAVMTHDGATLALYQNGVLISSQASTLIPDTLPLLTVLGGASHEEPQSVWKGRLQDIAVYAAALTPAQVAQHYALRRAVGPAVRTTPQPDPRASGVLGLAPPFSLGPFDDGPLKLSDLYALGATGTLTIVGVPY